MLRARAGVSDALMEAVANGDCGLLQENLLSLAEKLLEIGSPIIAEAMRQQATTGGVVEDVIDGRPCVFLPHLHRAEQSIAGAILKLQAGAPPWPDHRCGKGPCLGGGQAGRDAGAGARAAVGTALGTKLAIITGGPGVGKITIIRSILHILKAKGVEPLLATPTGRAAKRLSESTGLEAKTIHRLLESRRRPASCEVRICGSIAISWCSTKSRWSMCR